MRNNSLWSNIAFEKKNLFPRIWFLNLRVRFWGPEIKHLKAHNFVWQGCFFFHYYLSTSVTNWMISNFHRFLILCICWDTPSEKTGLCQLPIVSSVFKAYKLISFYITKGIFAINFRMITNRTPSLAGSNNAVGSILSKVRAGEVQTRADWEVQTNVTAGSQRTRTPKVCSFLQYFAVIFNPRSIEILV